jgi:sugar lactone lactonase YvrE
MAVSMTDATCLWDVGAQLGEGPVWSAADNAVWFVDIKQHRIYRLAVETGERSGWNAPEQVSFLAPLGDGRFIVGLRSGLHRFDPKDGSFNLLTTVEPDRPQNRLNDGYVDTKGRLWFGSMDDSEAGSTGALYRLGADGAPIRLDDGYGITNGPTVSPDGRTLYHCETRDRIIYAFDLAQDGSISNKREFVRIERPGAHPDGPAIDAEGCVWIALFGGSGADRYSPQGELIGRVELPVTNVTKVAFGGADLRTLYITSAWLHLTPEKRAQQPLAGGLFTARVDTPGMPQSFVRVGL